MEFIPFAMDNFRIGTGHRYPFDQLEVGQAFIVPKHEFWGSAMSCARQHGKRYGKKFRGRTKNGQHYIERMA